MDQSAFVRRPLSTTPKSAFRRQLLLFGLAGLITAPAAFARGGVGATMVAVSLAWLSRVEAGGRAPLRP